MILEGCSNAGFSLTEVRQQQIVELYDAINMMPDRFKSYKSIQDDIYGLSKTLDDSKVRMLMPFLRKMGYVRNDNFEQRNALLSLDELFTLEGKCFIEYLRLKNKIGALEIDNVEQNIQRVDQWFSVISLINLISNGEEIYADCIRFLKKYQTMCEVEFFLMTTAKAQLTKENFEEKLEEYIGSYRQGTLGQVHISKHQNAYGYIKRFLIETGMVKQFDNTLKLNTQYEYIYNKII